MLVVATAPAVEHLVHEPVAVPAVLAPRVAVVAVVRGRGVLTLRVAGLHVLPVAGLRLLAAVEVPGLVEQSLELTALQVHAVADGAAVDVDRLALRRPGGHDLHGLVADTAARRGFRAVLLYQIGGIRHLWLPSLGVLSRA